MTISKPLATGCKRGKELGSLLLLFGCGKPYKVICTMSWYPLIPSTFDGCALIDSGNCKGESAGSGYYGGGDNHSDEVSLIGGSSGHGDHQS